MITLAEFTNKFFSIGSDFNTAYVFDDGDAWDSFCMGNRNADILFTLCSSLKAEAYLRKQYCYAEVLYFCAVDKGTIAILIDCKSEDQ